MRILEASERLGRQIVVPARLRSGLYLTEAGEGERMVADGADVVFRLPHAPAFDAGACMHGVDDAPPEKKADEEIAALLKDVAMQVAAANPRFARREDVSTDELDKEREIYRGQAAGTGKPDNVIEKIVQGKVEKFYADVCLVEQEFIRDTQLTVGKLVQGVAKKVGAPIEITRFVRMQLGESSGEA